MILAFIELLKLHSHSNRTVNVYVKENSELKVFLGYAYIININAVNIQTYTDSGSLPRKSTMVIKETPSSIFSVKTILNIIKNVDLNLSFYIQNSNLTQKERTDLASTNRLFTVNRCDFTLSDFSIKQESSVFSNSSHTVFRAVYQQSKRIKLLNLDIATDGAILRSTDPLNLSVENMYIDYSRLSRGFYILSA